MPCLAADVFKLWDKCIEECLQSEHPENVLIETYWELWKALKERVGTSSGFTGFSEYLFFRYILRSIEQRMETSFNDEKDDRYTNDISIFRSSNLPLLLTHDVDISKIVSGISRPMKTDIAVICTQNGKAQLVAAFELKVYVSDRSKLEDMHKRFDDLHKDNKPFLFSILFAQQYHNEMNEFLTKYPGRAFLISKTKNNHTISLNQAIEKIVNALSSLCY